MSTLKSLVPVWINNNYKKKVIIIIILVDHCSKISLFHLRVILFKEMGLFLPL